MAWFVTSRSENLDFHTARLTSAAEKPIAISTSGENVISTSFPCQSSDRPQLLPNTDAMLKPSNERKLNAWRTKQLHGNAMLETIANNCAWSIKNDCRDRRHMTIGREYE